MLLEHIRRFVSLTPEEEEIVASCVKPINVKNKEHLFHAGQVCQAYYFVGQGVLRLYSASEDGHEQIVHFGIDNWWITDYASVDLQKPAVMNLQALEPSVVYVLLKKDQEPLFDRVPKLERYFRIVLQRAYAAAIMRVHYIFSSTGEARYHHFKQLFPDFVQRIPGYMLASYLGFTPEFLSKIRAKKT